MSFSKSAGFQKRYCRKLSFNRLRPKSLSDAVPVELSVPYSGSLILSRNH